ncbi:hypothetical protein [Maricaulis salignorans]|uniref:hypothetical protein n=1 Tax=Maricaulis salignorans TaxID=144026 RepID=UPI003A95A4A7
MLRVSAIISILNACVALAIWCSPAYASDDWLELRRVEVWTQLVDKNVSVSAGIASAALGDPILVVSARYASYVELGSEVETADGQGLAHAGRLLYQSEAPDIPGIVYCGRVALGQLRSRLPDATCLIDADQDGAFDFALERASTLANRSSLTYSGFGPQALAVPIPYRISSGEELGRVRFELNAIDASRDSITPGPALLLTMNYFEGEHPRGDDGVELVVEHALFGEALDFWGFCIRFADVSADRIRFEYLGQVSETLTWANRFAGGAPPRDYLCAADDSYITSPPNPPQHSDPAPATHPASHTSNQTRN